MPGGDMYTHHVEFIEWARIYDTGSVNMRSKRSRGGRNCYSVADRPEWC